MYRVLAVGIFVIENINHLMHFESEVRDIVFPAISKLLPVFSFAIVVHAVTICLGMGGSLMFLLRSRDVRWLKLFMILITWSWWFHKKGEFLWEVADPIDFKNRLTHCLKNLSIFGLLGLMNSEKHLEVNNKKLKVIPATIPAPLFPRLLIALRPWSFPAALAPLLVTFSYIYKHDEMNISRSFVFTVGILALQSCANLLNSFCDFKSGLDSPKNSGDRTMVDSLVSRSEFPFLFLHLILIWFISFIISIPARNSGPYLTIYAVGIGLAVLYSAGARPLKYMGLGDLTVFLAFGPLLVSAAAAVSGNLEDNIGNILLISAPASLFVVAILHANNHRDMENDARHNAKTVSVRLGERQSILYYDLLVLSPPIMAVVLAVLKPQCRGSAFGGLVIPLSWRLSRLIRLKPKVPRHIDAETANVMMLFGLLSSMGTLLME